MGETQFPWHVILLGSSLLRVFLAVARDFVCRCRDGGRLKRDDDGGQLRFVNNHFTWRARISRGIARKRRKEREGGREREARKKTKDREGKRERKREKRERLLRAPGIFAGISRTRMCTLLFLTLLVSLLLSSPPPSPPPLPSPTLPTPSLPPPPSAPSRSRDVRLRTTDVQERKEKKGALPIAIAVREDGQ